MDGDRLQALTERIGTDLGGAMVSGLAYIGDKLGLFSALAGGAPTTSLDLADRTGLDERYVREWLRAMVAAEYVEHEAGQKRYFMTEEQAATLADPESRYYQAGMFQLVIPSILLTPKVIDAFHHGGGIAFSEMGPEVSEAIDRLHRPAFDHYLAKVWLPQVPGLKERMLAGMRILDVGCGLGRSSLALARAFPRSTVHGLDPDAHSIEGARSRAAEAGIENLEFLELPMQGLPADAAYDLILAFDCIHDMVDPVAALRDVRNALAEKGLFLWVEPIGSHDPVQNRSISGRIASALSPFHCMSVSLAHGGAGLGTLIGEAGARALAREAGFSSFEPLAIDEAMQQWFALRV